MKVTLSLHCINRNEDHIDIFFETESDRLTTYELNLVDRDKFLSGEIVQIKEKESHRKIYLDYSGEISQGRGEILPIWKGEHKISFPLTEIISIQKKDSEIILVQ
ncbi:MAG: hypothetical protein SFU98_16475 [Leptospiraceae bacterium]|nr:hypothetical protein [Leptospiraceae bacterium]